MRVPLVPLATYRLQFNRTFRFRDARRLIPYLDELSISDVYASPLVQARRGSPHGYDITDASRLNAELGTTSEFGQFARALRRRGMRLLLDIVPNHMAASSENPWWREVLEDGRLSVFARYFDLDWDPHVPPAEDKIVLPVLGERYEHALTEGRLRLALEGEALVVRYYDAWFPLAPASWGRVLGPVLENLRRQLGGRHRTVRELQTLLRASAQLAHPVPETAKALAARHRRKTALQGRLANLLRSAGVRNAVEQTLTVFNGRPGNPPSFDALARLLEEQRYRLRYWRGGEAAINYRRFFDISSLVGMRTEDPRVFAARHALHRQLVRQGQVNGVRVDHIDGLADPKRYLEQLQRHLGGTLPQRQRRRFYVIVEKILSKEEELPGDWPVHGTTGYDLLNRLGQLFVEPGGSRRLRRLYWELTGSRRRFEQVVYAKKRLVMESLFPGELRQLVRLLEAAATGERRSRELTAETLRAALVEVTALLPVYRTYLRDGRPSRRDRLLIRRTLEKARGRIGKRGQKALRCFEEVLLSASSKALTAAERTARREFARRWQQFTGPVMAKGMEDTALYCYSRLLALNEVGGEPDSDGLTAEEFHSWLRQRRRRLPLSLNASTTHDTKRSEDVRARLLVLSELSAEWEERLRRWRRWNQRWKVRLLGRAVPGPDEELLIYQTLIGCWPTASRDGEEIRARLRDYLIKAAREAKMHTRWRAVNAVHEQALLQFLDALLRPGPRNRFLLHFRRFHRLLAERGALNSLAQLLIKITAPGVPDFYQGAELWDFRLVDPDNRRPVNFELHQRLLARVKEQERRNHAALLAELLHRWDDGKIKLYLLWKALRFRRAHAELFLAGEYVALRCSGAKADAIFAFARRRGRQWAVVVVPRLAARLPRDHTFPLGARSWGGTRLHLPRPAAAQWRNELTGERLRAGEFKKSKTLPVAAVLSRFPVALLAAESD